MKATQSIVAIVALYKKRAVEVLKNHAMSKKFNLGELDIAIARGHDLPQAVEAWCGLLKPKVRLRCSIDLKTYHSMRVQVLVEATKRSEALESALVTIADLENAGGAESEPLNELMCSLLAVVRHFELLEVGEHLVRLRSQLGQRPKKAGGASELDSHLGHLDSIIDKVGSQLGVLNRVCQDDVAILRDVMLDSNAFGKDTEFGKHYRLLSCIFEFERVSAPENLVALRTMLDSSIIQSQKLSDKALSCVLSAIARMVRQNISSEHVHEVMKIPLDSRCFVRGQECRQFLSHHHEITCGLLRNCIRAVGKAEIRDALEWLRQLFPEEDFNGLTKLLDRLRLLDQSTANPLARKAGQPTGKRVSVSSKRYCTAELCSTSAGAFYQFFTMILDGLSNERSKPNRREKTRVARTATPKWRTADLRRKLRQHDSHFAEILSNTKISFFSTLFHGTRSEIIARLDNALRTGFFDKADHDTVHEYAPVKIIALEVQQLLKSKPID